MELPLAPFAAGRSRPQPDLAAPPCGRVAIVGALVDVHERRNLRAGWRRAVCWRVREDVQQLARGVVPETDGTVCAAGNQPATGSVERKRRQARAVVLEANALPVGGVGYEGAVVGRPGGQTGRTWSAGS
eukprot:scaffold1922_cov101-Isochrysis_galbana.AAC.5